MFTYSVKRAREMSQSCNNGFKNVQKSVMHVQSCSFTNINLSLFCRSRCRRHHCRLSSLLLSSTSPSQCKLFQFRFTDFYSQIVQLNEHKGEPALFAHNLLTSLPFLILHNSIISLLLIFFLFSLHHHHHISIAFPPDHQNKENGYTLSMQQLLGSFGRISVTYDWLMVALNTIDQSSLTLVQPNDPRNHCSQSLYPFSLEVLKWWIVSQFLACNHVIRQPCWGQNNIIFSGRIYMKIELFSSQRRETLLFLTTNMAAVTSLANQQYNLRKLDQLSTFHHQTVRW